MVNEDNLIAIFKLDIWLSKIKIDSNIASKKDDVAYSFNLTCLFENETAFACDDSKH